MAEALVATVLDQLAFFIVEGVRDEITLVVGVDKELKKLQSNFQSIRALLDDAERRQVREEVVQVWLQKLKAASFEIRDVLDEWNTAILKSSLIDDDQRKSSANKVLCFIPTSSYFCCFNHQVVLRRDIALKIKELNATLDSIASEKDRYNFTMTVEAPERHISTSSVDVSEVLGRDYDKYEIITKLLGESGPEERGLDVITIVGMGGLGKTTLAQLAYNDDDVKTHFDERIWVCVSEPFDKIRIAKAIYEQLGGNAKDVCELETLSERIKGSISGKRLLLVLDDVWTEDFRDWEPFKYCLRSGAPGSRVLVTTRKEKVADIIGTTYMHSLQLLSKEACWVVFSDIAFRGRSNEDRQRLEGVGREIADECKGLPLAVKTLASLMRDKKTEEDWEGVLNDEIWQQEVEEADVFRPLLLSYYDLPSPLKRCFLYCAIFPKDYEIYSVELIALWMAQDYLSGSNRNEMEETGKKYFDNLVMRSLLQDLRRGTGDDYLGKYCKMHDIVHDFVKFLTKKEFFTMEIDGSRKEASMDSERRHSTVVVIEKMAPLPVLIYTAGKSLHTLRIQTHSDSFYESDEAFGGALPANFFHDLKCLRALYLGFLEMRQLAEGVGKLIHLRYLNLRGNKFKILPKEVCDLCNLQTLDLSLCLHLKELPKEIWKLINLRQLYLDGTLSLSFLPKGIGRLSCLRILTKFIIGEDTVEACTIGDLEKLNHLGRKLEIEGLRNVKDASEARRAELKSKRVSALGLSFDGDDGRTPDDVVEALQPHPKLKILSLSYFGGIVLPNWISSLTQLVKVDLQYRENYSSLFLFPLATLPLLEKLAIYMMHSVEVVVLDANKKEENNKTSVPMDITAFPKLRVLKFHYMYAWEEWKEAEITRMMPCLHSLQIVNCPKLKALPHYLGTTPLRELFIHDSPILEQRCQMEIGEDWPKISHIPYICFEYPLLSYF